MNYSLSKLLFMTPLHAGNSDRASSLDASEMSLCADTLFSALCCTADIDSGEAAARELCEWASEGQLYLSDMMPYHKENFYIPRPYLLPRIQRSDVRADRKAMKNLKFLPLVDLPDYIAHMTDGSDFSPEGIFSDFGVYDSVAKVSLKGMEVSSPYSVGTFSFDKDCGLYFIMASPCEDILEKMERLVILLGLSGIGGKVSSGYGKFRLAEDPYIFDGESAEDGEIRILQRMLSEEFPSYMSITTSLPNGDEMEKALAGSSYSVRRRGGFVRTRALKSASKKETQFFLGAGSVFKTKFEGGMYSVSKNAGHPVLRYSKPIFLGVDHQ
ncbi:MAG: type III-A CRISPR-associated RAMP protein Csm4 [Synergistaceae bacterium]